MQLNINVKPASLPHSVCRQIEAGARMIISLTSCSIALSIEEQCELYHIPHFAVPKPVCSLHWDRRRRTVGGWDNKALPWIRIDPLIFAKILTNFVATEDVVDAAMITDGLSGERDLSS